jgi:hypothetical protein
LFLVALIWAAILITITASHAVFFTPSEVAVVHAWVQSHMAL